MGYMEMLELIGRVDPHSRDHYGQVVAGDFLVVRGNMVEFKPKERVAILEED